MNQTVDEKIFEQIAPYIADKLGLDQREVTRDADLQNDLGADSLDMVEMLSKFQIEFKCTFPSEEQEQIRTVGDVVDNVKSTSALEWIRNDQVQPAKETVAPKAAEPAQKAAIQKPSGMVLFFMTRGGKKLPRKTLRKPVAKLVIPQKPMMLNPGKKR